jgi:DNA-directed RNA polymerase specialized sigma24 family protein
MNAAQRARAACREVEALEAHLQELVAKRREAFAELVTEGHTQREIAAIVGVSQPRVCQILGGR